MTRPYSRDMFVYSPQGHTNRSVQNLGYYHEGPRKPDLVILFPCWSPSPSDVLYVRRQTYLSSPSEFRWTHLMSDSSVHFA